jgi:toxin YhaV
MQVNGWNLYQFTPFSEQIKELTRHVMELSKNDPHGYRQHPKTKLLASVFHSMKTTVPANPDDPVFRLGSTLGKQHTHWRRVKKGLPQRYRLFFRFSSTPIRVIIYAYLNDENTLRKEGSKTDVYEVFRRKLERGEVPSSINELLQNSFDS